MTGQARVVRFHEQPADERDGVRCWRVAAARLAVEFAEVAPGAVIEGGSEEFEHMVVTIDAAARVSAGGQQVTLAPRSLAIVPGGASTITVEQPGALFRVLATAPADAALPLRSFSFDAPPAPRLSPNVYRSEHLMLNAFSRATERRDTRTLTPHSHDDFEQISLCTQGDWVHHLRYPWGSDMAQWRDDEHLRCASPSLTVIPAGVIHTTCDLGEGVTEMFDVFSPPRPDFLARPGMVVNAEEYP